MLSILESFKLSDDKLHTGIISFMVETELKLRSKLTFFNFEFPPDFLQFRYGIHMAVH